MTSNWFNWYIRKDRSDREFFIPDLEGKIGKIRNKNETARLIADIAAVDIDIAVLEICRGKLGLSAEYCDKLKLETDEILSKCIAEYLSTLTDGKTNVQNEERAAQLAASAILLDNVRGFKDVLSTVELNYELINSDKEPPFEVFWKTLIRLLRLCNPDESISDLFYYVYTYYDDIRRSYIFNFAKTKCQINCLLPVKECDKLNKLLALIKSNRDADSLFQIYRVYEDLDAQSVDMSFDEIADSIFVTEAYETGKFPSELLSFVEFIGRSFTSDPIRGVNLWSSLVQKRLAENDLEKRYRPWFCSMVLCKQIIFDPERCDDYIENADTFSEESCLFIKARSIENVNLAFETLLNKKSNKIDMFFRKIFGGNFLRFDSTLSKSSYCVPMGSLSVHDAVRILAQCGYDEKSIVFIYLNSCLRRLMDIGTFVRCLTMNFNGISMKNNNIDLEKSFGEYIITGIVSHEPSAGNPGVIFKAKCFNDYILYIDPAWFNYNKHYCETELIGAGEVKARIKQSTVGKNSRIFVEPVISKTNQDAENASKNDLKTLFDLLERVESEGELSTETNKALCSLSITGQTLKKYTEEISVRYLRCCAAIASNGTDRDNQIRYFINCINSKNMKIKNPCRHSNSSGSLVRYSQTTFSEIINCWIVIRSSSLSLEKMLFIYFNTALKHCIVMSDVLRAYSDQKTDLYECMNGLSDYWIAGCVTKYDPERRSVRLLPDELCSFNRRNTDIYEYIQPEDDNTVYKLGKHYFFKISEYYPCSREHIKYLNLPESESQKYISIFSVSSILPEKDLSVIAANSVFTKAIRRIACSRSICIRDVLDVNVDLRNLNSEELTTMRNSYLNGLRTRIDDSILVNSFMCITMKNNLWKFSTDKITFEQLESTNESNYFISRLCRENAPDFALRIYFNSPYKTIVPLETVIKLLSEKCDIYYELRKYPLIMDGSETYNFCSNEIINDYPEGIHSYVFEDYSEGEGILLEPVEEYEIPEYYSEDELLKEIHDIQERDFEEAFRKIKEMICESHINFAVVYFISDHINPGYLNNEQKLKIEELVMESALEMLEKDKDVLISKDPYEDILSDPLSFFMMGSLLHCSFNSWEKGLRECILGEDRIMKYWDRLKECSRVSSIYHLYMNSGLKKYVPFSELCGVLARLCGGTVEFDKIKQSERSYRYTVRGIFKNGKVYSDELNIDENFFFRSGPDLPDGVIDFCFSSYSSDTKELSIRSPKPYHN